MNRTMEFKSQLVHILNNPERPSIKVYATPGRGENGESQN